MYIDSLMILAKPFCRVPYNRIALYLQDKLSLHLLLIFLRSEGNRIIKDILYLLKARTPYSKKSCIIYWYKCSRVDCDDEYIIECGRTFGKRYKEHLRAPSYIQGYQTTTGHLTTLEIST